MWLKCSVISAQTLTSALITLMVVTKAVPTPMDRLCVPVTVDSHCLVMEGHAWI